MKIIRVERHLIKKSNPMWKLIDYYSWEAKNIYNAANFIIRQEFINTGKWIRYNSLGALLRNNTSYYKLGSQNSQMTLRLIDKDWTSFFKAIKDWSKKKGEGYLGKPGLPNYKKNRSPVMLTNNLFKIRKDGTIYFSWKPLNQFSGIKTRLTNEKTFQIRFIPKGSCYYMEIVYETDSLELQQIQNIIGIDLGINNFATISNNIGVESIVINGKTIKSMNQNYNRLKSKIQKETGMIWNNRLRILTDKHQEKLDYFMHKASRIIIDYCLEYGIDTIAIGNNNEWKQNVNLGKRNNQNFVHIPYEKFISKLRYKAENIGINFFDTEENYTSGTSFLDNEQPIRKNYNKKRRVSRGMFVSNSGVKINADLNGSYQIIKKVFPNAFMQWDRGCSLHPIRINF